MKSLLILLLLAVPVVSTSGSKKVVLPPFEAKVRETFEKAEDAKRGQLNFQDTFDLIRKTPVRRPSRSKVSKLIPESIMSSDGFVKLINDLKSRSSTRRKFAIVAVLVSSALVGEVTDKMWLNADLALGDFISDFSRLIMFGRYIDLPVIDSEVMVQMILSAIFLYNVANALFDFARTSLWLQSDAPLNTEKTRDAVTSTLETSSMFSPATKDVIALREVPQSGSSSILAMVVGAAAAALGLRLSTLEPAKVTEIQKVPAQNTEFKKVEKPQRKEEWGKSDQKMTSGEKALLASVIAAGGSFIMSAV